MKRFAVCVTLALACANTPRLEERLRDGDIIFHESRSSQSRAIQLATKSRYSHMGILYRNGGRWFVYEAVQPVKLTPLRDWIARGKDGHFVVKRLADRSVLTPAVLKRMRTAGEAYRGKGYDLYFEWSDTRIYCSELVWKIYKKAAGVELGHLQQLREFDLSHPAVRSKMRERYGDRIPRNEPVISPAAMFESKKLVEVVRE
jgi:Permuted papain-like amidase enzyme, YaeF/YiiX, C92 family